MLPSAGCASLGGTSQSTPAPRRLLQQQRHLSSPAHGKSSFDLHSPRRRSSFASSSPLRERSRSNQSYSPAAGSPLGLQRHAPHAVAGLRADAPLPLLGSRLHSSPTAPRFGCEAAADRGPPTPESDREEGAKQTGASLGAWGSALHARPLGLGSGAAAAEGSAGASLLEKGRLESLGMDSPSVGRVSASFHRPPPATYAHAPARGSAVSFSAMLTAALRGPNELADAMAAARDEEATAALAAEEGAAERRSSAQASGHTSPRAGGASEGEPQSTLLAPALKTSDWSMAEQRTFYRLQALVWLVATATADDDEQRILERVHFAAGHMQRGEEGATSTRLLLVPAAGASSCWHQRSDGSERGAQGSAPAHQQSQQGAQQQGAQSPSLLYMDEDAAENGLTGFALGSSQPLLVVKASADPRYRAEIDGELLPGQSLLLVPFSVNGGRWLLSVASRPNEGMALSSPALLELMAGVQLLASHARTALLQISPKPNQGRISVTHISSKLALRMALRSTVQRRQLHRLRTESAWLRALARMSSATLPKIREAEMVSQMQQTLYSTQSVTDLATSVMATFQALVYAERSTLYTYDWTRNALTSCLAAGMKNFELKLTGTRLGIIGLAVTHNEALLVEDCYSHPNFNPAVDRDSGFHSVSMLCLPLLDGEGEVIGAVQLINKLRLSDSSRTAFTNEDLALCKNVAMHIGLALMNIRQREQIQQFQEKLAKARGLVIPQH